VKSAWICSRNDVVGNVAVIIAGVLVGIFSSQWPDIIIGFILAFIVLKSSFQIIASSKKELNNHAT
jgi:Co/Zn/Cd efflux system component